MKHFLRNSTRSNFLTLRTDFQYIPTDPLSNHYSPIDGVSTPSANRVVEEPSLIVVETPILESWEPSLYVTESWEDAPLEFSEKIALINEVQRDCQKLILNEVQQDCQQFASLDAQIEREISETLEASTGTLELDREISTALEHFNNDFSEVEGQIDALQTQHARNVHIFYELGGAIEKVVGDPHSPKFEPPFVIAAKPGSTISGNLGGPGGGGSNWHNGGGGDGSNWHNGGDPGNDPPFNYIGLILFGGAIIIIGRIIVNHGSQMIQNNLEKLLSSTKKQIDDIKRENGGSISLKRRLPSLLPVLASGPALVVLTYLFHPQRLRELVELLAEMGAILAHQIGRLLLQALPPQLREAAQRIGHLIEVVGAQLRRFVDQVVLPVALYGRALALLLVKVYFLLKLASLGFEVYKICGKAVPDSVVAQAHQIAEAISGSSSEASILLFVENFLKSVSLLVVGLIPVPKDVPKLVRLLGRVCIVCFVLSADGRVFVQKVANGLLAYPFVVSLCGCIAGRWAIIVLTVNIARGDTTLRRYSAPFVVLLYVLRVYELAMTASPNLLPN